ncbi:MAG: hypothetical protein ACFCVD_13080 [Nodosilinea sp.]
MFLDELSPFVQELFSHPAAFLGGFASGLLRLSLADDPVKSWLSQQGVTSPPGATDAAYYPQNGGGPQSISID